MDEELENNLDSNEEQTQENCDKARIEELENEIAELEEELDALTAEKENENAKLKDINGMYVRLQSDFDNYRKRTNEQLKKTKDEGVAEAITKILPVLDVINQALQMITDDKVAEGVRMIERQLLNAMTTLGVSEIPALGKDFNPDLHNAMLQVKAEKKEDEGKIMEVFQKGYQMGERILRHSVVKVAL